MLTVKVSKVASSSGDDKRVQIFNCIKSYTSVTGDKTKGGHGEKIKRVSLNIWKVYFYRLIYLKNTYDIKKLRNVDLIT